MAAIASGMFGIIAATRSPLATPSETNNCCRRDTSACSSSQLTRRSTLSSPRKTIASEGPVFLQEVFGKVDVGIREEHRARHLVAVGNHAFALLADDAAIVPQQRPERFPLFDRPGVQVAKRREVQAGGRGSNTHEVGHRRCGGAFPGRRPKVFCRHRLLPQHSIGLEHFAAKSQIGRNAQPIQRPDTSPWIDPTPAPNFPTGTRTAKRHTHSPVLWAWRRSGATFEAWNQFVREKGRSLTTARV